MVAESEVLMMQLQGGNENGSMFHCLKGACAAMVAMALLAAAYVGVRGSAATQAGDGADDGVLVYYGDWQIGSTGIVDEADVNKISFSGARAILKTSAGNTSAVIRYSVRPPIAGESAEIVQTMMRMRYKDNGDGARVVARLKVWFNDGDGEGTTSTLMILDSNENTQLPTLQQFGTFDASGDIDFDLFAVYYIEVTLTRSSSGGTPEIGAVEMSMYK